MSYIYQHLRKSDGKPFYIGKGSKNRAYEFAHSRNPHWHNVFKKHGCIVEILEDGLTDSEAYEKEIELIADGRKKGWPLVNITNGGDGLDSKTAKRVLAKARSLRTHEGFARGGKVAGQKNVESGWAIEALKLANAVCDANPEIRRLAGQKGGKIGGKIGSRKTNHIRWHVRRNIINAECEFCVRG